MKINSKGQITIPQSYRKKLNLTNGIALTISELDGKLIIEPAHRCSACGRALPDELLKRGACIGCTPPKATIIY